MLPFYEFQLGTTGASFAHALFIKLTHSSRNFNGHTIGTSEVSIIPIVPGSPDMPRFVCRLRPRYSFCFYYRGEYNK